MKALLATLLILIGVGASVFFWVVGVKRQEIALSNKYEAKAQDVRLTHDNMWKTLKEQFGIQEQYKETFLSGLAAVAEGRKGGSLFKMSTESSSQLGLSEKVFQDMMHSIDGKRAELMREQKVWVDVWKEHKTLCEDPIKGFVVGDKILPEPKIIVSTRTQNAAETGIDDETLFR